MELACPIHEAATAFPTATAIEAPDAALTFRELDGCVRESEARLRALGLGEGDRLGLFLDNSIDAVVLLFTALRMGVVACPVSTRLPVPSARTRLDSLGVTLIVSERAVGSAVSPRDVVRREGRIADEPPPPIPVDRPATIVFTSGSTGASKGVVLTVGNHVFNARGSNENIAVRNGDRWLLSLPLYHVGGIAILFRCVLGGATVVLPNPNAPLSASIAQATHVSLVPTQLGRILSTPGPSTISLKAVLVGGDRVPQHMIDEAVDRGVPVATTYGMTEMASQVTTTAAGAQREDLRSSGRVLPYRELRIGEDGRILVRGQTRFAGYATRSGLEQPFDADGWFATGDLGAIDTDGRLHVRGRVDNMFVSGGENIRPEQIEEVLQAIDGVARVLVVSVEDDEYGRRPVAFVEMEEGAIDPSALRLGAASALPRFMVPDAFYAWPTAAADERMKPDRREMERLAAARRAS